MVPAMILIKINIYSDLVELVRRYSNRADLQERLGQALQRAFVRTMPLHTLPGGSVRGREPSVWRLRDRLSDGDVRLITERFRAGTAKHVLADEFGVSLSSIKSLLRQQS